MSSPEKSSRVTLRADPDGDLALAAIYDQVTHDAGGVPKLYQALGAAPALLRGWIDFAWALRADSRSSRALRELAILRCAQLCHSDYVWRSHVRLATKAGLAEDKVAALAGTDVEWSLFDPVERVVLNLTAEVFDAAVTDATWDEAAAHLAEHELVELVLTVSWYAHVARVVDALGVPLESHHHRVPSVPSTDRRADLCER